MLTHRRMTTRLTLLMTAACTMTLHAAPTSGSETKEQRDVRMKWFRDDRSGMFIHYGLYAVPVGEYKNDKSHGEWYLKSTKMRVSQYERFTNQFNPVKFDAPA